MRVTRFRISRLISDLVFIIGTSFQVDPFASLLCMLRHSTPVVVINNEPVILPNEVQATYISGDCEDSVLNICEQLGWKKELLELCQEISKVQRPNTHGSVRPKFYSKHQHRYIQNDQKHFVIRGPPKLSTVEDNQFPVEMILKHRRRENRYEFLIRWQGYPESYDEWVKRKDVCPELVKEYFQRMNAMLRRTGHMGPKKKKRET